MVPLTVTSAPALCALSVTPVPLTLPATIDPLEAVICVAPVLLLTVTPIGPLAESSM